MKEAVREALAEERSESHSRSTVESGTSTEVQGDSSRGSGRGGKSGRGGTIGRLVVLAMVAGAAYFVMRRQGIDIEEEFSEDVGFGEGSESSVEDPMSSQHDYSESGTEEETDEESTTSS